MAVTVVMVDDHPSFRTSARTLLELEGFDVVGEATDGRTAVRLARELRPEVVLLDIQLPDLDGFAVAQQITEHLAGATATRTEVVLTSGREPEDYGPRLAASPHSFLRKDDLNGAALEAVLEDPEGDGG
jgi:DNA-binding NarL/FixJ family response regulator